MNKSIRTSLLILIAILVAWVAPSEKILGTQGKLVYFHGAWVWAAILSFAYSSATGLYGFLRNKLTFQRWSVAFSWSALGFWLIFLPMSLWVMQVNWNGLFLEEPRFRIPLIFAVVVIFVQVGLLIIRDVRWSALVNILIGLVLFWQINQAEAVLHPQSPIFNERAGAIRWVFILLIILLTSASWSFAENLLPIVDKMFGMKQIKNP